MNLKRLIIRVPAAAGLDQRPAIPRSLDKPTVALTLSGHIALHEFSRVAGAIGAVAVALAEHVQLGIDARGIVFVNRGVYVCERDEAIRAVAIEQYDAVRGREIGQLVWTGPDLLRSLADPGTILRHSLVE